MFLQALFVDRPDLFEQHDGILRQSASDRIHLDMGGQTGFILLAGDRRRDDGGTESVAHIVLHNEHRTDTALFRSHHRAQISVINISSADVHLRSFLSKWPAIPASC